MANQKNDQQHDDLQSSIVVKRINQKGFTELGKMAFPHLQHPVLEKGTVRLPNKVWDVLAQVTCDNKTRDALILDAIKNYFWKSGWSIDSNLNFKYESQ